MVVEYIRYVVPAARAEQFEAAYRQAGTARIEWDSVDGHEHSFRSSPGFPTFCAAVQPFFDQIAEMKHYQALDQ